MREAKPAEEQSVSLQAQFAAMNMHLCCAGCGTPIWVGKDYCDHCQDDIDALNDMTFEAERRRAQIATERIRRREQRERLVGNLLAAGLDLWDHLRNVDWITVAILTGMVISVSVCAFDFGKAFAEWWMSSCK